MQIDRYGGPEVLEVKDLLLAPPGPGEVRVRNRAIGVNFIDIYHRTGAYPVAGLPFTPGKEGAGEVVALGPGVSGFAPGDRVAYVEAPGAYAEEHNVPAQVLLRLPDTIDYQTAAAMMLKGLTAQYLLRRTYRVEPGQTVLVHAAAGGVGLILAQWAKHLGATVIGTVGSPDKVATARANGCDHVVLYREEPFPARVMDLTRGQGCHVVYDGIGQATFPGSLDCLRPFGSFVSFGSASGPIAPFDIALLAAKGSLFATFPLLPTHIADRDTYLGMARELFGAVEAGAVEITVHDRLALSEAAEAHRRMEARETMGATILLP
ncbi:MAG: quinone oxidoreductase [Sphingomonas sp.]|nr:quinone oxidoreductase [Sphingomonas sp.]